MLFIFRVECIRNISVIVQLNRNGGFLISGPFPIQKMGIRVLFCLFVFMPFSMNVILQEMENQVDNLQCSLSQRSSLIESMQREKAALISQIASLKKVSAKHKYVCLKHYISYLILLFTVTFTHTKQGVYILISIQ